MALSIQSAKDEILFPCNALHNASHDAIISVFVSNKIKWKKKMSLHKGPNKILAARLTVNVKMFSDTVSLVFREKYEKSNNRNLGRREVQSAVNV